MKNNETVISDYFNSCYKHVNKDFDIKNYGRGFMRDYGKLLNKEDKILDIGCGTGFLLKVLEDNLYLNLYGIERDKAQFEESKKLLKTTKLYNKDVLDYLKENNQKFNVIFLMDLIEHIPKDKIVSMLKQLYSCLDKNGFLIIKTPSAESPLFSGKGRYCDFTHKIAFNQNSIKMVLREAGFNEILCKSTKFYYNSPLSILSWIVRFVGNFILRLYLASYLGIKEAINIILTPNFITIAKK